METNKIKLTREDFERLVAGLVVRRDGLELVLEDLGYTNIMNIVKKAQKDNLYKFDE